MQALHALMGSNTLAIHVFSCFVWLSQKQSLNLQPNRNDMKQVAEHMGIRPDVSITFGVYWPYYLIKE